MNRLERIHLFNPSAHFSRLRLLRGRRAGSPTSAENPSSGSTWGRGGPSNAKRRTQKSLRISVSLFSFRASRNIFFVVSRSARLFRRVSLLGGNTIKGRCSANSLNSINPRTDEMSCASGTVLIQASRSKNIRNYGERGRSTSDWGLGLVHVGLGEISPRRAHCASFLPTSMDFASPRIVRLTATTLTSSTPSAW